MSEEFTRRRMQRTFRDARLLEGRRLGLTYGEIKERWGFSESLSSLRSRFRDLSKKHLPSSSTSATGPRRRQSSRNESPSSSTKFIHISSPRPSAVVHILSHSRHYDKSPQRLTFALKKTGMAKKIAAKGWAEDSNFEQEGEVYWIEEPASVNASGQMEERTAAAMLAQASGVELKVPCEQCGGCSGTAMGAFKECKVNCAWPENGACVSCAHRGNAAECSLVKKRFEVANASPEVRVERLHGEF
ncbi:hypothetical protein KEM55_005236 [Ascosphaera atra]|nr:hypothetical protein KEM55_005236 [Ascosphaera atra]